MIRKLLSQHWFNQESKKERKKEWFSSVQSLSQVRLFASPWTAARQASLSITNSEFAQTHVHSFSDAIQRYHPLLFPSPPTLNFPNIRVFPNESVRCIKWLKYCSFSFSISPSNEYSDWFPLGWTGWISLQSKGLSRVFSNTTVQNQQFLGAQLSS